MGGWSPCASCLLVDFIELLECSVLQWTCVTKGAVPKSNLSYEVYQRKESRKWHQLTSWWSCSHLSGHRGRWLNALVSSLLSVCTLEKHPDSFFRTCRFESILMVVNSRRWLSYFCRVFDDFEWPALRHGFSHWYSRMYRYRWLRCGSPHSKSTPIAVASRWPLNTFIRHHCPCIRDAHASLSGCWACGLKRSRSLCLMITKTRCAQHMCFSKLSVEA